MDESSHRFLPCHGPWGVVAQVRGVHLTQKESPGGGDASFATQYQFVERLQAYPLVLVVSWSLPTAYAVQEALAPSRRVFLLAFCAYTLSSLMGFLNASVPQPCSHLPS